ncbi:hypothetical protein NX059_001628 [Plenodomus lindquistii]|nr:hypothetical protein NX059_001628 [Plenodomus lindquistii]
MERSKPRLVWVEVQEVEEEDGYQVPMLDELLAVPGNANYIGRGFQMVRGNLLRQRPENSDTLNLYYIDEQFVNNFKVNNSLHFSFQPLVGDAWGETLWKGPIVAILRDGNAWEPRKVTDITLTAYRDAIDYLGYF